MKPGKKPKTKGKLHAYLSEIGTKGGQSKSPAKLAAIAKNLLKAKKERDK